MADLQVTTISGADTVLKEATVAALKQSLRGCTVTKIVQTWPMSIGWPTQSDLSRQPDERLPGIDVAHSCAMPRHEERHDGTSLEILVAPLQVVS